jgi:sugar phosphate isomerase/epimerase
MDARVGFVTQVPMDHIEAIEFAGEEGFDYVELMLDGAGERRRIDVEAARTALADAGVDAAVHLPFGGIDVGSPLEHVREGSCRELEAAIDCAADLGATVAVAHASAHAWGAAWDEGDLHEALLTSVRRLDAYGADRGVEVCFENVPRNAFDTHDLPTLFAETDASATLDTGHARIDGRDAGGMAALVSEAPDRIRHVHLNDTRGRGDEHLPFGAGDLDFGTLFEAFPADWGGTLSLEVFTPDYGYVAESKRRLDAALRGV